jgi:hypothetical protein
VGREVVVTLTLGFGYDETEALDVLGEDGITPDVSYSKLDVRGAKAQVRGQELVFRYRGFGVDSHQGPMEHMLHV